MKGTDWNAEDCIHIADELLKVSHNKVPDSFVFHSKGLASIVDVLDYGKAFSNVYFPKNSIHNSYQSEKRRGIHYGFIFD